MGNKNIVIISPYAYMAAAVEAMLEREGVHYRLTPLLIPMIYPQSPLFQAGWLKPDTVLLHVTKGVTNSACRTLDSFNAIESLNSVIRQAIKERKVFPTDDSVRKVIYLAIESASKKWSMPIQNWQLKMSRFIIEFGDHLNDHL